eukprot:TRINITY_DN59706_c0_g1_i1.p1 TRINITY_DN59706_c0_g1~~TRINITY_DN59706_c0_g1_i1.p1  ORF type:complete len:167 (+),score=45.10 TRINITY_DN59706_c0_g1_i1:71-502(+)
MQELREDLKVIAKSRSGKLFAAVIGTLSAGYMSYRYVHPPPVYIHGMTMKPLSYYVVDAEEHGMDGVRYRSEPRKDATISGFYPGNGTVLVAKEANEVPDWIMLPSGYWLPLTANGKPCIKPFRPLPGTPEVKAFEDALRQQR